ncbi:MAG: PEGA domain-containing protein [Deltaproteobacteria bacterium]|nr:PEGA domain-containing protein [Deltaproteobacteria bacterium]
MRAGQHGQALGALASLVVATLWGGGQVCAQAPHDAQAEAPESPTRRVLVVVLPVDAANAVTADALTELVIGTVASSEQGTSILGKEEFQAQLGQNDEATLECIGSSTCLSRVGVQLGVAEVLAATLARREGKWIFDLHRIDTRSGESVANAYREVEGELGELADAMIDALAALDPAAATATLRVGVDVPGAEVAIDGTVLGTYTGTPLEAATLAPGAHEVRVRAEGHLDWVRSVELADGDVVRLEASLNPVAPATIPQPPEGEAAAEVAPVERHLSAALWVGLAAVVVGAGAATGFGISSAREPEPGVNRAEALAFADDRRRDARIANAGIGLAVAGLGVMGVGFWLSDFGGASGGSRARVSVTPGGAALDWSTQW